MKILQIMPQYPWPTIDGGKVGLANIALQYVAQGHEVHLVCYHDAPVSPPSINGLHVHIIDHAPRNTPWRMARSLLRRRALYMFKHDTAELRAVVDEIITREDIDVIHADHTCMAPIAKEASLKHGIPWGFRLHNVEWMIWDRYAEKFPVWHPSRWYLSLQAARIRREESQLLADADVVFAITPVDRDRAREMAPHANIVIAPAGVDPTQWSHKDLRKDLREALREDLLNDLLEDPHIVVMASTYRWVHNVDALQWFVDNVWPRVRADVPDAEFHVIGSDPPAWLFVEGGLGIVVRGFVDDLAGAYANANVSVAPLFVGSGMRLKIIEAMAAGLPVVATTISAEGIELFEPDGLFRYDEPEQMAEGIVKLLRDRPVSRALGVCAQQAVAAKYTWAASVGMMLRAFVSLKSGAE